MNGGKADVAKLVEAARAVMRNAYAPYSRFAVGAAVRLTDGEIVTACNFENASYGLSLCAEAVVLATINSMGRLKDLEAIAVAGGAMDAATPGSAIVTPCGRCRQIIKEAQEIAARPLPIYCAAAEGEAVIEHCIAALLPHAFGPKDMGITTDRKG